MTSRQISTFLKFPFVITVINRVMSFETLKESISSTFYEQLFFYMKVFCAAFWYLKLEFIIFWRKGNGKKGAHKILVKLTPGTVF